MCLCGSPTNKRRKKLSCQHKKGAKAWPKGQNKRENQVMTTLAPGSLVLPIRLHVYRLQLVVAQEKLRPATYLEKQPRAARRNRDNSLSHTLLATCNETARHTAPRRQQEAELLQPFSCPVSPNGFKCLILVALNEALVTCGWNRGCRVQSGF